MTIKFEKWQGLGNDFVILFDEILTPDLAAKLCDRHFGIGADGIFCPKKSNIADIGWDFYNSDGSIAQMCGNGIRCFSKFVYNHKLVDKKKFSVETLAGIITPEILDDGRVLVDMGTPVFEAKKIPVDTENASDFEVNGFKATAVSMGNPHCVIYTDEDSETLALIEGPKIEIDPMFPEKTNVEFINIISKDKIKMDVWERGCGITLACGTGACASTVAGVKKGLINNKVEVILPGGSLTIEYNDKINRVYMTGSATLSFEGEFNA